MDPKWLVAELLGLLKDKRARAIATSLAMEDQSWSYEGCLKLIDQFESGLKHREKLLSRKIKESSAKGDDAKVTQLLAEKMKYVRYKAEKQNFVRRR